MTESKKVRLLRQASAEKWVLLSEGRIPKNMTCCLCRVSRTCPRCPLYEYTGLSCVDDEHPFEKWSKLEQRHNSFDHLEVMAAAQKVVDAIDGAIAQQEGKV